MKLSLIYKGGLLWFTTLSVLLFLSGGAESLVYNDKGYFALLWLACNIILISACHSNISFEELAVVSGATLIDKLIEKL